MNLAAQLFVAEIVVQKAILEELKDIDIDLFQRQLSRKSFKQEATYLDYIHDFVMITFAMLCTI